MDDALDETITAKENAEKRTLWTRQQVIEMLRLQRRDDAAQLREFADEYSDRISHDAVLDAADEIYEKPKNAEDEA